MEFIQKELKEIKELLKKQTIQQKEFLTVKETAIFLGLSESRIHKITAKKEISYCKPGGKVIYFRRVDLEQWILSGRVASTNDVDDELDSYLGRTNKNL
ncbi:helix-turn-helix domain-containing protein [Winogradskyella eckloniae]|uniref:helix-turn-helix transcriptional regulator n=1 Tax=Winogradskyella eckloniae TaxID=1089306 RepID=UPI0015657199|nr:helix-turn-helix domain-containing protein [Winogradskyella eckloniae]NRD18597.1 helix-turn-helix domain-containing protein [Winogradskyella eckloniae]